MIIVGGFSFTGYFKGGEGGCRKEIHRPQFNPRKHPLMQGSGH